MQRLQLAGTSSTVFAVNLILNFSKGRTFQFLFGFVDPFSRIHMLVGVTNVRQMCVFFFTFKQTQYMEKHFFDSADDFLSRGEKLTKSEETSAWHYLNLSWELIFVSMSSYLKTVHKRHKRDTTGHKNCGWQLITYWVLHVYIIDIHI